jgi:trans-aconitate methyltransferase
MIPSDLAGTIYDAGSGWGNLAIKLAKRFPDCKIIGIENSPIPYAASKILSRFLRLEHLHFIRANFLNVPMQDASLLVCYLYPGGMKKIKTKLLELQPGTPVISNTFSIPGWEPLEIIQTQDLYRSPIYLYKVPMR